MGKIKKIVRKFEPAFRAIAKKIEPQVKKWFSYKKTTCTWFLLVSEWVFFANKEQKISYKKDKYSNYNDIGKDDTRQVLQPYFHSGPHI